MCRQHNQTSNASRTTQFSCALCPTSLIACLSERANASQKTNEHNLMDSSVSLELPATWVLQQIQLTVAVARYRLCTRYSGLSKAGQPARRAKLYRKHEHARKYLSTSREALHARHVSKKLLLGHVRSRLKECIVRMRKNGRSSGLTHPPLESKLAVQCLGASGCEGIRKQLLLIRNFRRGLRTTCKLMNFLGCRFGCAFTAFENHACAGRL